MRQALAGAGQRRERSAAMNEIFFWDYWGYRSAAALILWVPFSIWLFSRQRATLAATHCLVWGMMWLPERAAFDFPALPPFTKYSIAAMAALLGVYWKARPRLKAARFGRGYDVLVFIMMLAEAGTVLTNSDPLHYGTWKFIDIPAFKAYDGVSAAVRDFAEVGIPILLGRALIRNQRDLRDVFSVLAVAGIVYSIPILWETRMSPMLHVNLYGFAPRNDWAQNLRMGGYRATVFMGHGLVVGFFMFICTTAAVAMHKAGKRQILGVRMHYAVIYLFAILAICKAAAALIYGLLGMLLIRYMNVKNQMRVLMFLALIVVSYPVSRLTNVFPTQALLSAAGTLGPERVESLQFRFDNEDILVIKAVDRWVFGWGGFGRDRVYDVETGKDFVVQDGHWITLFGSHGAVGYICYFLLLLLPIYQATRRMHSIPSRNDRALLAGLGFIVVLCAVNMLPNMQLPNLQFFLAAGLGSLIKELPKQAAAEARAAAQADDADAPTSSRPPGGGLRHVG
jgi:hypothetical protein